MHNKQLCVVNTTSRFCFAHFFTIQLSLSKQKNIHKHTVVQHALNALSSLSSYQ